MKVEIEVEKVFILDLSTEKGYVEGERYINGESSVLFVNEVFVVDRCYYNTEEEAKNGVRGIYLGDKAYYERLIKEAEGRNKNKIRHFEEKIEAINCKLEALTGGFE